METGTTATGGGWAAGYARRAAKVWLVDFAFLLVMVFVHATYPDDSFIVAIQALAAGFIGLGVGAVSLGVMWAWLRFPERRSAVLLAGLITGATLVGHLYIINTPAAIDCYNSSVEGSGCVLDEVWYVPVAISVLAGAQCTTSDLQYGNCNQEHPFLAKALIAAGIAVFGNNAIGWRAFAVALGTACLPLLFLLVFRISRSTRMAAVASALLGMDVLFFLHSGAALIDVQAVFFALGAFLAYEYRVKLGRLGWPSVAGILFGVGGLSKETAVFLVGAFITYYFLLGARGSGTRERLLPVGKLVVAAGITFAVGTQAFDSLYLTHTMPTFIDQVRYMISYFSMHVGAGFVYGDNVAITPLNWFTYYWATQYYATYTVGAGFIDVGYLGISNMVEMWATFVWVPVVAYVLVRWRQGKETRLAESRVGTPEAASSERTAAHLGLIWLIWGYVPFVIMWGLGGITYPFYLVPAMPGLVAGLAYLLTRKWVPRWAFWAFLGACFVFFFVYYPFKGFLPDWLRALIYF